MNVEAFAADTLLERGLPLPIRAPLFFRLLGIRSKCYQPTLGNKVRINSLYLKMNIKPEILEKCSQREADQLINSHSWKLCRIIAFGMVTGWIMPIILTPIIAFWIRWNIAPKRICAIAFVMITQSGTSDFLDTTRCIEKMSILKPSLGQTTNRS